MSLRSSNPADRAGHTFIRFTAMCTSPGKVAVDWFRLFAPGGAEIHGVASVTASSETSGHLCGGAVDPNPLMNWISNTSGENWIEIAFNVTTPRAMLISQYQLTVLSGTSAEQAPIRYRIERLTSDDYQWQIIDSRSFSDGGTEFLQTINDQRITVHTDAYGSSAPPFYAPPTVTPPASLASFSKLSAIVKTKTSILLRWPVSSTDMEYYNIFFYRRVAGSGNSFVLVHTFAGIGYVNRESLKTITHYLDTVPVISDSVQYEYKVVASTWSTSFPPLFVLVNTLSDDEVYVQSLTDRILTGLPLSLAQAAIAIVGDRARGESAAGMITNSTGTHAGFKVAGFNELESRYLTVLALCMRDSNGLLDERFRRAQKVLSTRTVAKEDFFVWAEDHLRFNLSDILSSVDSEEEQQMVVSWVDHFR